MPTNTPAPSRLALPDNTDHPQPNRVLAELDALYRAGATRLSRAIGCHRPYINRLRDQCVDLDAPRCDDDGNPAPTRREQFATVFDVPTELFDRPLRDVITWVMDANPDYYDTVNGELVATPRVDATEEERHHWARILDAIIGASGRSDAAVAEAMAPTADDVQAWRTGTRPLTTTDLQGLARALGLPVTVFTVPLRDAIAQALETGLFDEPGPMPARELQSAA